MPSVTSQNLFSKPIQLLLLTLIAGAHAASTTEASSPSTTIVCERYRHTGFWDIDIDNYSDFPPECGPPFSLNADRDPNHLPYQLIIIFASYLALTIFVGSSILTIRLRRKSKLHPKAIELQLVEKVAFDPRSPQSPNSILSWMKNPLKKKSQAGGEDPRSPGIDSIASFDHGVLETDRAKREAEMDRLYAAVLAHDQARKSQLSQVTELNVDRDSNLPPLPRVPSNASTTRTSRALTENGLPTRISAASSANSRPTDRRLARVAQGEIPKSPMQQRPSRLYTPQEQYEPVNHGMIPMSAGLTSPGLNYPMSPTGQIQLPNDMYPASPPPGERRMRLPNQPFTPAFSTMQRGMMSPATTIGMLSPATTVFSPGLMSARTQLPNDMYPASPARQEFDQDIPPTPSLPPNISGLPARPNSAISRTGRTRKSPPSINVNTNLQPDDDDRAPLSASFHNTPLTESETSSPEQYFQRPQTASSLTGRARRPPTLNLSINNKSTNSLSSNVGPISSTTPVASKPSANAPINKPLPLRVAFDSTAENSLKSPGIVKTTVLQPRRDAFMRGPRTARTPMTGQVPPTPYSAYMPFTPVTPITPHLVTRKERKQRKKQEGKTLLDESDLVREESDEEEDTWNDR